MSLLEIDSSRWVSAIKPKATSALSFEIEHCSILSTEESFTENRLAAQA